MTGDGRAALTRRGIGVMTAAGALLMAARLFGSPELAGLGAAAAMAVGAATVVAGRAPMTYRGERWLAPAQVSAGAPAAARLRFTNTGPRPTPAGAEATDPFGPAESAVGDAARSPDPAGRTAARGCCVVPALRPGAMAEASFALPTERRGCVAVGPLAVQFGDPLGLVQRRVELAGTAQLVVHPRIHPVLALPGSATAEARRGASRPAPAARGDDFFALREYEVGDDLRRVHWRSTARVGDLMLRQDELRIGEVATVLVDTRAAARTAGSFDRALEVAASVAAALVEDGRRLRFVTTGGFDVAIDAALPGAPAGHRRRRWAAILEHLALASPDPGGADAFALALQSLRSHPSGPLAAIVGHATPAELAALGALRPRAGLVLVVQCDPPSSGNGPGTAAPPPPVAGAILVPAAETAAFPALWNESVLLCGGRERVRR